MATLNDFLQQNLCLRKLFLFFPIYLDYWYLSFLRRDCDASQRRGVTLRLLLKPTHMTPHQAAPRVDESIQSLCIRFTRLHEAYPVEIYFHLSLRYSAFFHFSPFSRSSYFYSTARESLAEDRLPRTYLRTALESSRPRRVAVPLLLIRALYSESGSKTRIRP